MRIYKNVKEIKSEKCKAENGLIFTQKKLRVFGLLFICVLCFGVMGVSLSKLGVSVEIKNITASWAPNLSDFGKLKYVIKGESKTETEVVAQIFEMSMPFENTYLTEIETGVFMANGLGGLLVKSCLDGTVSKIDNYGDKKNVYVSHGKGLVSVYEELDNVGVKKGDGVKKNSPLGVSLNSSIRFKVMFKDKILAGLTVKDGELSFI